MSTLNESGQQKTTSDFDLAAFSSLGEELELSDRQTSAPRAGDKINGKSAANIRVLLVEDHVLVRAGIRALLESVSGVEVMGEASNGAAALAIIAEDVPDVAILDISMRGMNGLELTAQIARTHPSVRVLVLSMHANQEYVLQAIQNGAAGYLLKDSGAEELETALCAVLNGEQYLSPKLVEGEAMAPLSSAREATPTSVLTSRQREILVLLAQGNSNGHIASRLGISIKTVETHRQQLMTRLSIFEVAGLVRYAIRHGLVDIE